MTEAAAWTPAGSVSARIEAAKCRGEFAVAPAETDRGDFEYMFIARVPAADVSQESAAKLAVDLGPAPGEFEVDLQIDPDDPATQDDRITLASADGSFSQMKTVRDDNEPGDGKLTLRFEGLTPGLKYTLTVDPGEQGAPYAIFRDRTI